MAKKKEEEVPPSTKEIVDEDTLVSRRELNSALARIEQVKDLGVIVGEGVQEYAIAHDKETKELVGAIEQDIKDMERGLAEHIGEGDAHPGSSAAMVQEWFTRVAELGKRTDRIDAAIGMHIGGNHKHDPDCEVCSQSNNANKPSHCSKHWGECEQESKCEKCNISPYEIANKLRGYSLCWDCYDKIRVVLDECTAMEKPRGQNVKHQGVPDVAEVFASVLTSRGPHKGHVLMCPYCLATEGHESGCKRPGGFKISDFYKHVVKPEIEAGKPKRTNWNVIKELCEMSIPYGEVHEIILQCVDAIARKSGRVPRERLRDRLMEEVE